jgi:phage FluMu gp28-like protein
MRPDEKEEALQLVAEIQSERTGAAISDGSRLDIPRLLLPSQIRWHLDQARVRLAQKGRRVGFTWGCWAPEAVGEAGLSQGGMDQFYMGYNQGMAAEFIGDCAMWARWYGLAMSEIDVAYEAALIENEKRDVVRYKIQLASGQKIEALSAMPYNWRGRQGHARIDEAGHHKHLGPVIDGAMAYLIWGGRVSIGGTHNGEDNYFNDLVKDCKADKLPWSLHTNRFSEAVREGLFKRICLVTKKPWSPEAEAKFIEEVRDSYRSVEAADEELECIPMRGTGVYFSRMLLEKCAVDDVEILHYNKPATFVLDPDRLRITQQWIDDVLAPAVARLPSNLRTVLGQDFARDGDLSPIVIGQAITGSAKWRTPLRIELRKIPFDCQKLITAWLLLNLPLFHHAKFDARGNGQSHAEAALQLVGPQRVECVQLTGGWYDTWFPRYHQAFEDGDIHTFGDEDWIADHRSVVLVKGSPRMSDARTKGADGGDRHGDTAVSGVLMWAAARQEAQPAAGESVEPDTDTYRAAGFGRRSTAMFGNRADAQRGVLSRAERPGRHDGTR